MIFIYIFVFLFFLVDCKPKYCKKEINENFLSKDTCFSVKGLFVVLVFLSHSGKYVIYTDNWVNKGYYSIAGFLSQLIVVMFFFYSGYGIMEQTKNKKDYIKNFFTKRFLPTYLSFAICVFFYYILALVLKSNYSSKQILLSFTGYESIGNSNWFMFITFIIYIIYFFSFRFTKSKVKGGIYFSILLILSLLILHETKENWWWNTFLCFPLGMWWSLFQDYFKKKLVKTHLYILYFIFSLILFFLFHFLSKRYAIVYVLESFTFAAIVVLVTMKFQFTRNNLFAFLGKHVFSIYILQRLIFIILDVLHLSNYWYVFIPFSFILTIIISVFYDKFYDTLCKGVHKIFVKE